MKIQCWSLIIILCSGLWACDDPPPKAPPAKKQDESIEIANTVKQLKSRKYKEREAADIKLRKQYKEKAVPACLDGFGSADLEQRRRCEFILLNILPLWEKADGKPPLDDNQKKQLAKLHKRNPTNSAVYLALKRSGGKPINNVEQLVQAYITALVEQKMEDSSILEQRLSEVAGNGAPQKAEVLFFLDRHKKGLDNGPTDGNSQRQRNEAFNRFKRDVSKLD